jgi:hypothetical protein
MFIPYFIFVRAFGRISDAELLYLFGLDSYRPAPPPQDFEQFARLAGDDEWIVLTDDPGYTLCSMPSTLQAIHQLGQTYDVFACSVGDTDGSFGFVYYRDGQVVRRYVVEDPYYRGGTVIENTGEPLPGEEAAFQEAVGLSIVLSIAASLGIRTAYTEQDFRVYAPPENG